MQNQNNAKKITSLVVLVSVSLLGVFLFFSSFTIIDATERGVVLRFGDVNRVMDAGFNWKQPFLEKVIKMPVTTQRTTVSAGSASQDLQTVNTTIALQYNLIPSQVGELYKEFRKDYKNIVIDPAVQDSVKASTAKFNAEELITKRAEVKNLMEKLLRDRLAEANIRVSNLDITNFEFSKEFDKAIEEKVTAEQEALREENKLRKVEFEAQQKIEIAKAEATRTRLEVEALRLGSDLIEKIRAEAQLEASKKWNGVLPTHMYGSAPIPLLNLTQ